MAQQMTAFRDSQFCVYFTGDISASWIVTGWDAVVSLVNAELHLSDEWHQPDDPDEWGCLDGADGDDRRFVYTEEVDANTSLWIVRITEQEKKGVGHGGTDRS